VFTDDNQAVYDISKRLLIPAITHQTPVKERHAVLERFKSGEYPVIVTSKVLNEGVDVPEANVAVVLSGSGSTREHVQRLGRILRRKTGKFAVLFEVVAKDTVEEGISRRRKGEPHPAKEIAPRDTETVQRQLEFAPVSAKEALEFENLEFESLGRD
jgi:superfamily II DNA or RNA helicase